MANLPTPDEMLDAAEAELNIAYRALGDAADWLRSVGSALTPAQAERRNAMRKAINTAMTTINQGKGGGR